MLSKNNIFSHLSFTLHLLHLVIRETSFVMCSVTSNPLSPSLLPNHPDSKTAMVELQIFLMSSTLLNLAYRYFFFSPQSRQLVQLWQLRKTGCWQIQIPMLTLHHFHKFTYATDCSVMAHFASCSLGEWFTAVYAFSLESFSTPPTHILFLSPCDRDIKK